MQLQLLFFAQLSRQMATDTLMVDWPVHNVPELIAYLQQQYPVQLAGSMVAINEHYASPQAELQAGDVVAFLPPLSGGAVTSEADVGYLQPDPDTYLQLTHQPLLVEAAQAFVQRPAWGAQAMFVGSTRSPNRGQAVQYLHYQAYTAMVYAEMQRICSEVRANFPELGIYLVHRLGRVEVAERSVIVAVGSPHRRAALEACDALIEAVKARLPIWKEEYTPEGAHWVEGSTPAETV